MELASIFINAGIFVATVIAAVIAWRAVNDAREARDDASASAERAVDATESIAAELAAANQIRDRVRWQLEPGSKPYWIARNVGPATAYDAELVGLGANGALIVWEPPAVRNVAEGEALRFMLDSRLDIPTPDVEITWTTPGADDRRAAMRLTIPT